MENNATAMLYPGPLSNWFKILITSLDSFLAFITLMGGLTTLYIVYMIRAQCSRLSCLLGCLAVSDILTAAVLLAFDLPTLWNDNFAWVLGGFACKAGGFLQGLAVLANSNTIIAIAVDRYLGIVQAPKRRLRPEWGGFEIVLYVLFITTLSCGISAPYTVFYELTGPYFTYTSRTVFFEQINCDTYFCWSDENLIYPYQVSVVCVIIVPMLFTFLISYGFLMHFLVQRRSVGASDSKQLARKRKVMVTVCAMMINFLVLRIPSWIFLLVPQPTDMSEAEARRTYSYTHYSLQSLTLCASALNPILYSLLQQSYRQFLPQMTRPCIRSSKRVGPLLTTSSRPSCGTMTSPETISSVLPTRSTVFQPSYILPNVTNHAKATGGMQHLAPVQSEPVLLSGSGLYDQLMEEANPRNRAPTPKLAIVLEVEEEADADNRKGGYNS
ncbi:tachykinin-like peptides receptor 86C [Palaemon carinicauda]|uniref:tachykinin-like peptides receptor 86C n=1 Tax=Palaemon carinicauda TaxID=392227 RepID=UPI0035B6164C